MVKIGYLLFLNNDYIIWQYDKCNVFNDKILISIFFNINIYLAFIKIKNKYVLFYGSTYVTIKIESSLKRFLFKNPRYIRKKFYLKLKQLFDFCCDHTFVSGAGQI